MSMWDCYHELLGRSWVLRSFHSLDLFSSHFGGQLLIGGFFSPKSPVDWNLFKIRDPPHLTYINGKKCKKLTNWFSLDSSRVTLASSWAFFFSSCTIFVSYENKIQLKCVVIFNIVETIFSYQILFQKLQLLVHCQFGSESWARPYK